MELHSLTDGSCSESNSQEYNEEDTKDSEHSEENKEDKNNSDSFNESDNDSEQLNEKSENETHLLNENSEQPDETQDIDFLNVSTFEELGVNDALCSACKRIGWASPTQIQIKAIPSALKGHDIIGLAETGSGKTGAFALPILQNLMCKPQRLFALILTPTRELAFQIKEQLDALGQASQITSCVVVGGIDMRQQADALRAKPHIVVGTPGRLLDHLKKTKDFQLKKLKYLVMDEADRILQMDFQDEVNAIMQALPCEKKVFLFSATMTTKVNKLQRVMLTEPVKIEISSKFQTVKTLKQYMLFVPYMYKIVYLACLLYEIGKDKSVIIFCMTCSFTLSTAITLRILGFNAFPIFGLMDQNKRLGVLNKFKSKEKSILLATDVASRCIRLYCLWQVGRLGFTALLAARPTKSLGSCLCVCHNRASDPACPVEDWYVPVRISALSSCLSCCLVGSCDLWGTTCPLGNFWSVGLDIPNVDYVINFDCPIHSKDYIHRVGRTARAGKQGTAITLVDQYTALSFVKIEKDLETKIPLYPIVEEDVMVFKDSVLEAASAAEKERQTMDKKGEVLSKKKRYKASIKAESKKKKK